MPDRSIAVKGDVTANVRCLPHTWELEALSGGNVYAINQRKDLSRAISDEMASIHT
jgi:hypothetical protein